MIQPLRNWLASKLMSVSIWFAAKAVQISPDGAGGPGPFKPQ